MNLKNTQSFSASSADGNFHSSFVIRHLTPDVCFDHNGHPPYDEAIKSADMTACQDILRKQTCRKGIRHPAASMLSQRIQQHH